LLDTAEQQKAEDVHFSNVRQFGLSPDHLVSTALDEASNMSRKHGGVQVGLNTAAPSFIIDHC